MRAVCSYRGVGCGMVLDLAADATGARRVVIASTANRETVIAGWTPPNGRQP